MHGTGYIVACCPSLFFYFINAPAIVHIKKKVLVYMSIFFILFPIASLII